MADRPIDKALKKKFITKEHKSKITDNMVRLGQHTDTGRLYTRLIAAGVIDDNDKDDIEAKPNRGKKNEYLYLNIMLGKSEYDYSELVRCLKESRQEAAAEILADKQQEPITVSVQETLGGIKQANQPVTQKQEHPAEDEVDLR
jgi:hypothetical protein